MGSNPVEPDGGKFSRTCYAKWVSSHHVQRKTYGCANGDHYEYVVVYVDDLGVAAKVPSIIVEELMRRYGFKLKGTGPIQFHLGSDYFRDQHGVL